MTEEKKQMPDNVIFVGQKFFMNYVQAVQMIFREQKEVIISARGKFISRAVDIEEVITILQRNL